MWREALQSVWEGRSWTEERARVRCLPMANALLFPSSPPTTLSSAHQTNNQPPSPLPLPNRSPRSVRCPSPEAIRGGAAAALQKLVSAVDRKRVGFSFCGGPGDRLCPLRCLSLVPWE